LIKKITATSKELRKFGLMFAALCVLAAAYAIYKGSAIWPWFAGGAAFFLGTGLALRQLLRPIYIGWMTLAFALGWINTRVLLGVFFYVVLTPIGLVLRLTGKDLLNERIDRSAATYWKKRDHAAFNPKQCERQF
jgi:hypothetical protein